jgi:RHS repeat-associated protein
VILWGYSIRLDWQEQAGAAKAVLMWSSASQPKQVIPASQLFPGSPTPTPTFSATKTNTPTATKTYTPTSTPAFNPPSGQVWKFYYYVGSQRVAMRVAGDPNSGANGVFYTLGDHLGSTSLITSSSGVKIAESRYMPWGETRFTTGYQPSDYLYTGQREDSYIKLYQMGARWYDPALGRFTQPDTIIPVAEQGIQAWDRYAYVNNNPIRHVDPSGHNCAEYDMSGHIVNICNLGNWWSDPSNSIGISLDGTYNITWKYGIEEPKSLPNYPKNIFGGVTCNLSLPECFGDIVYLQDFSEYDEDNPIPIDEFEQFADKVAEDLHTHNIDWPGYNSGRQIYDTPFYNGGESERRTGNPNSESGIYPSDQQVCIETIGCYGRSDINYIAQGMWGAAVGEPKFISIGIVKAWKYEEYGESPSEATLFWLNYGYDYYLQWLENNE